jgi:hypothetical protein
MMSSTTPGSDAERPHDADGADRDPDDLDRHTDADADARAHGVAAPPDVEASDSSARAETSTADEPASPVEPAAEPVAAAEPARPDDTARLDAAVERASTLPAASEAEARDADVPEPVAADSVRRDTYVPSSTATTGAAAGAATLAPESEPFYVAPQPAPQTIYVQAPTPPKMRGNRGFAVLVALVGTVLFALLYAGVSYLLFLSQRDATGAADALTSFLVSGAYWVPVVVFFIGFTLLAIIINRGAWWYYAVFGLLVAVLVYLSYLGGALLTVQAWNLSGDEVQGFVGERWFDPLAIAAFIVAREIPIWLGGWIAAHGRTVAERNRVAREAYDRELAAGPQPIRTA